MVDIAFNCNIHSKSEINSLLFILYFIYCIFCFAHPIVSQWKASPIWRIRTYGTVQLRTGEVNDSIIRIHRTRSRGPYPSYEPSVSIKLAYEPSSCTFSDVRKQLLRQLPQDRTHQGPFNKFVIRGPRFKGPHLVIICMYPNTLLTSWENPFLHDGLREYMQ